MQNKYTGDIGDFVKYGLIRAVAVDAKIGVAWYLHPDDGSADGGHTDYLERSNEWRHVDCELYDGLKKIVKSGQRSVAAVQCASILRDAAFADEPLDVSNIPTRRRVDWRRRWFDDVVNRLADCAVVFADPDNGLQTNDSFRPTRAKSAKSTPECEALALAKGRPTILYHHNTRRKGGHRREIAYWQDRLPGPVYAYYWRRWSNRTFFLLNLDDEMVERLKGFDRLWSAVNPCGLILPPDESPRNNA